MTKKSRAGNAKTLPERPAGSGCNLLLAMTLVPLVIGGLLILAWALDIEVFGDPQAQITTAVLLILLGFAASNVLQRRWRLAAGWGLLIIADLVVLAWLDVRAQVVAIGFGIVGLIFLVIEFYRQYQQGKVGKARGRT